MEIKLNLKQTVYISIWVLLLIVTLLLVTTRPYLDILTRVERFAWLLGILGATFTILVIGYTSLPNEHE